MNRVLLSVKAVVGMIARCYQMVMGMRSGSTAPTITPQSNGSVPNQEVAMAQFLNTPALLAAAERQIGQPYVFGSKPDYSSSSLLCGPTDCSGFVKWCYSRVGVVVPDGSENQYEASTPVSVVQPGDLVFLKHPNQPTHHVGMVFDANRVIESHGSMIWDNEKPFQVIFRARHLWEQQPDFDGYRRFKSVLTVI